MKFQFACISVAALALVTSAPAGAADFGNNGAGSIKDMSGSAAVAVPAPVPMPEYKPSYYFRVDLGYGIMDQPSISESGFQYGGIINNANGYPGAGAPDLQSFDPSWIDTEFHHMVTYGAGVGYYIGHGWRVDATLEGRNTDEININGKANWESHGYVDLDGDPTTPKDYTTDLDADGNGPDRQTYIDIKDKTTIRGSLWMANLYYDLTTTRGFTPYVGAGLGFAWNRLSRDHTTTVTSEAIGDPCGGCQNEYTQTTNVKSEEVSLAAAAMVGASYQLSEITSLDMGYRYLYIGSTNFNSTIDGYESNLSIGAQSIHQLRAGLRFDVN